MIKLERTSVTNFDNAMRGARNPMNSWGRYDSYYDEDGNFVFGPNDLSLAKRLCKAGTDHRKFIRMIFVTVDVTAPMYWWKEYDTYKVGTVANSTSTMHKIASKPFELADFSVDHMDQRGLDAMEKVIRTLEQLRLEYLETKGVTVIGYGTEELPAFYTRKSGFGVDYRLDSPEELAAAFHAQREMGLKTGMLVTNPIPEEYSMDADVINKAIDEAVAEAKAQGIHGKATTPFLLAKIKDITGGSSLDANIQLVYNNARLAAKTACELAKLGK